MQLLPSVETNRDGGDWRHAVRTECSINTQHVKSSSVQWYTNTGSEGMPTSDWCPVSGRRLSGVLEFT